MPYRVRRGSTPRYLFSCSIKPSRPLHSFSVWKDLDSERIIIDVRPSRVGVATGLSRNAVLFKRKNHFGSLKYRHAPGNPTTGAKLDDLTQGPYNVGEVVDNLGQRLEGKRLPPGAPDSEPGDPLLLMNRVFPRPRQEICEFT